MLLSGKSEMVCVKPDQHQFCFIGDFWTLLRDGMDHRRAFVRMLS